MRFFFRMFGIKKVRIALRYSFIGQGDLLQSRNRLINKEMLFL